MDSPEEMSGTFLPRGGGEAAATSSLHSCLPALAGEEGVAEQFQEGPGPSWAVFCNLSCLSTQGPVGGQGKGRSPGLHPVREEFRSSWSPLLTGGASFMPKLYNSYFTPVAG